MMKTANWRKWRNIPVLKAWQACALSLDIDPDSMTLEPLAWMVDNVTKTYFLSASFPDTDTEAEFNLRRDVLLANLADKEFFSSTARGGMIDDSHDVQLFEFAHWAHSKMGWSNLPSEFVLLARKPDSTRETGDIQSVGEPRESQAAPHPIARARKDLLSVVIEEAMKKATDRADTHSVWIALKEMALGGRLPFTGTTEGKDGLPYTNDNDQLALFTKDALRKRMHRSAR